MRLTLAAALLLLCSSLALAQCVGGYCLRGGISSPPPVIYQPRISYQPRTIQVPVQSWQPMQYQGSQVIRRQPWTPIRNLFGWPPVRVHHQYVPYQQPAAAGAQVQQR